MNSYLVQSSLETVTKLLQENPQFDKIPKANVLAVTTGGRYILALVTPPERKVKVMMQQFKGVQTLDVTTLFSEIQVGCQAWCMID